MFSVFFWVACFLLFLMQFTAGAWLHYAFPSVPFKYAAVGVPLVLSLLVRWGLTFPHHHFGPLAQSLYYFTNVWVGFAFIAFCVCMLFAFIQWILLFWHIHAGRTLGILSVAFTVALWGTALWGGLKNPAVKTVDVYVEGAPQIKVALLSDSHLGMGVSVARFERALNTLQQEKPDLLLVLGDVFEYGPHREKYAAALNRFQAPLGKYGVLGNHEYYNGYENALEFYRLSGITLLQNQTARPAEGLTLAGVNDIRTARVTARQIKELLSQRPETDALFYLSHQPLYEQIAADAGVGLMVSGHTHNGQIFPFNFLVRWKYPHIYGLYQVDLMNLYVTSGWFYWGMPLRLFSPAEMAILRINA